MTAAGWFTAGAALVWLGWALALRSVWLVCKVLVKHPDYDQSSLLRNLVYAAFGAGLSLGAGSVIVRSILLPSSREWRLPLVWWVMPFPAWLALACFVLAVASLVQMAFALNSEERAQKRKATTIWLVGTLVGFVLYRRDPEDTISVLKGSIPFQPTTAIALMLLATAAVAAMAFASRAASSRKLGRGIVTHAVLITGSIVFGVPLLFLLITSFKEDRDMSSSNGIVWIPRVQRTIEYSDPKNPVYETQYEGHTVQATISSQSPDGTVQLDVVKPLSLNGLEITASKSQLKPVSERVPLVTAEIGGVNATAMVVQEMDDGTDRLQALSPPSVKGKEAVVTVDQTQPIRDVGLRWQNYTEALSYLPPETTYGLVFLKNTLLIAILSVVGTILSSSLAAYAFARMRFPGRDAIFAMFLATMMLPAAVTMMPQFLIFRDLGWIDTLLPLWVPAFFGSALNIFLLRQFFRTLPTELEDAAKIDGCSYARTFWSVMLPQIKPALAVIGVTTFMAAWNNFMGPLIYINSQNNMPISYALQLYNGDRGAQEPGLLMAFVTLTIIPILLLFFFAQRYFIEGVTLSGLGGK